MLRSLSFVSPSQTPLAVFEPYANDSVVSPSVSVYVSHAHTHDCIAYTTNAAYPYPCPASGSIPPSPASPFRIEYIASSKRLTSKAPHPSYATCNCL